MLLLYYITLHTNHTETTSVSSDSTTEIDPTAVTFPTTLTSLPTTSTPTNTAGEGRVFVLSTYIAFHFW